MSIAVIGGVITSTLLTLIVVPIFYTWLDRLTIRGRRERRAEKAANRAAKKAARDPERTVLDGVAIRGGQR
jgi:HAE1 family hydrophobic/amphiphilic exporter-1